MEHIATQAMIASMQDGSWLVEYKRANHEMLAGDPEFAAWLEHEYVPLAGGWQY